jgi:hypothetical protein
MPFGVTKIKVTSPTGAALVAPIHPGDAVLVSVTVERVSTRIKSGVRVFVCAFDRPIIQPGVRFIRGEGVAGCTGYREALVAKPLVALGTTKRRGVLKIKAKMLTIPNACVGGKLGTLFVTYDSLFGDLRQFVPEDFAGVSDTTVADWTAKLCR